jgi:hypothetical protein
MIKYVYIKYDKISIMFMKIIIPLYSFVGVNDSVKTVWQIMPMKKM